MRNPKAGPAAYLLLRGEGNSEDATSPAGSASCLRVSVLHSRTNVCTLGDLQLAGYEWRGSTLPDVARPRLRRPVSKLFGPVFGHRTRGIATA